MAVPAVLAGSDLLGIAATGTGKTAAFALPILQRLAAGSSPPRGGCRALVLAPTRELAAQIGDSFRVYGRRLKLRIAVVVGGVPFNPQATALAKGVDVLIATPGRLLDHLGRGTVRLDSISTLVLDEADHMLDLGFIPDVRRLVARMPSKRQTLLFSATMPKEIRSLADDFLSEPEAVSAAPPATPAERVDQSLVHVTPARKGGLLADILRDASHGRVLVFTRTKRGADRVARNLAAKQIDAAAIHGNKSQGQRQRALAGFRAGRAPVLVATDIAARGIDVDGIGLVVNYELPNVAETYVHRIGRTGRAGADGAAVSFCAPDEQPLLRAIETLIRTRIPARADEAATPGPKEKPCSAPGNPIPKRPAKASRRKRSPAAENRAPVLEELPFMRARGTGTASRRRQRAE